MVRINLKQYYPVCDHDVIISLSEEVAAQLKQWQIEEDSFQRQKRRYRAYYTLEHMDYRRDEIRLSSSPYEIYERNMVHECLCTALSQLPSKQAKRIFLHYFVCMSQSEIARAERVSRNTVSKSIRKGLETLQSSLNEFSKEG